MIVGEVKGEVPDGYVMGAWEKGERARQSLNTRRSGGDFKTS